MQDEIVSNNSSKIANVLEVIVCIIMGQTLPFRLKITAEDPSCPLQNFPFEFFAFLAECLPSFAMILCKSDT